MKIGVKLLLGRHTTMNNQDVYQIDADTFIKIVKNNNNIHQALLEMGLNARGSAYKTFKQRCDQLSISLDHFINEKEVRDKITNEEIKYLVLNHLSCQSILKSLRLNPHTGTNVRWINKKLEDINLDTSHWTKQGHLKNKTHSWNEGIPLEEILIVNSKYTSTSSLKKRLLKVKLLEYKCNRCGLQEWLGEKLSLQLEHKNGINTDNRLENLCLLCPNCHSQTETFAGKNIGRNGRT